MMDPLHATIEEFAAEGYTHVECSCPHCRKIRLRPMSWLPRISMGLTIARAQSSSTISIGFKKGDNVRRVANLVYRRVRDEIRRPAITLLGSYSLDPSTPFVLFDTKIWSTRITAGLKADAPQCAGNIHLPIFRFGISCEPYWKVTLGQLSIPAPHPIDFFARLRSMRIRRVQEIGCNYVTLTAY